MVLLTYSVWQMPGVVSADESNSRTVSFTDGEDCVFDLLRSLFAMPLVSCNSQCNSD